jgi:hypothetical protein
MEGKSRRQALAALAAEQYGVVSYQQVMGLGYSSGAIEAAVDAGFLHRVHRAVFAVGHLSLSPHCQCLAAVMARGERALLSYRSAAWLWGFVPSLGVPIEVSVPWRGHGRSPLHVHHCPALRLDDEAMHEGIPVTAVPRTLLDCASVMTWRQLERAVDRTERLGLLDIDSIDLLLEEVRRHPGRGRLRRALSIYRDPAFSRSGGELRFLELLREAGLPRPAVNMFVEGHEIDFYWEAERFAVELDGWESHRGRSSFERDPRRQEDLKLAGIEMIRITGHRLANEPDQVAERLRALLRNRREELLRFRGSSRS